MGVNPMPMPTLPYNPYLFVLLVSVAVTLLMLPISDPSFLPNSALLYVLLVVLIGSALGRRPAILAALCSALLYAHVFVPPRFSLAITEGHYLLSAAIMLTVALLVGHLTASLKHTARQMKAQESRTRALYELARKLAATLTREDIERSTAQFLQAEIPNCTLRVLEPDAGDSLVPPLPASLLEALKQRQQTLRTSHGQPGQTRLLVPMLAASGLHGILVCDLPTPQAEAGLDLERLESIASLAAVALERTHFADAAHQSEMRHSTEVLRNSILSALSHDLRTPLTGLIGIAETLCRGRIAPEQQTSLLTTLHTQALHINRQVGNLLDMARLRSGQVELSKAWQPAEEVLGVILQQAQTQWPARSITVTLAADLPPLYYDAVLMERALWNLLENAVKYSPPDQPIEICVRREASHALLSVCDRGRGLPQGIDLDALCSMFRRGEPESNIPGMGLGLAIARTIARAHAGDILASNRPGGGACFTLRIPLVPADSPPAPSDVLPCAL